MHKKNLLVFSPFQGIAEHSFIERFVANSVKAEFSGGIEFLTCNGILNSYCLVMNAVGLSSRATKVEKERICRNCNSYSDQIKDFNRVTMESLLSDEDINVISQEVEKAKQLKDKYEFRGLPIGRITLFDVILGHKIRTIGQLIDHPLEDYLSHIRNNLTACISVEKYLKKRSVNQILFYNGNYSINNTIKLMTQKFFPEVECLSIHYGLNWSYHQDSLFVTKDYHQLHLRDRQNFFREHHRHINYSKLDGSLVESYQQSLFEAKSPWVYSSAKSDDDIFDKLSISPEKPFALLCTASLDELFAVDYGVFNGEYLKGSKWTFKDQIDWVERTVDFFRANSELQLVLRVHPREFPNKREGILSPSAKYYSELKHRLPPNVMMNTPDQNVSIYDLFEKTSLCLTSWSSVGLEASMMGVPTASITQNISLYPNEYVHFFTTQEDQYFTYIVSVLKKEKIIDQELMERAKNWLLFDFNMSIYKLDSRKFWRVGSSFLGRIVRRILKKGRIRSYEQYEKNTYFLKGELASLVAYIKEDKPVYRLKL